MAASGNLLKLFYHLHAIEIKTQDEIGNRCESVLAYETETPQALSRWDRRALVDGCSKTVCPAPVSQIHLYPIDESIIYYYRSISYTTHFIVS